MAHENSKWRKIETAIAIKKKKIVLVYVNYSTLVNGKKKTNQVFSM